MGAGLLTGPAGCGKTALIKKLISEVVDEAHDFLHLTYPIFSSKDLIHYILTELTKGEYDFINAAFSAAFIDLVAYLKKRLKTGIRTTIIIDNAHCIENDEVFEVLRRLINDEADGSFIVSLIIAGSGGMSKYLRQNRELEARLSVKCVLEPFSEEETYGYINHRLTSAGAKAEIFDDESVADIYAQSGGLPLKINRICDLSLLTAFSLNSHKVTSDIVKAVIEELSEE